jgi:hypothetical protein
MPSLSQPRFSVRIARAGRHSPARHAQRSKIESQRQSDLEMIKTADWIGLR